MLELVREMLPHANITEICVNVNLTCGRHRDRMNSAGSYILFFDGATPFVGGALVFDDGTRYEEKEVWQGPFDGKANMHWNEPHEGAKYSVVAYSRRYPTK